MFPPILAASQIAFVPPVGNEEYRIYFTLPNMVSLTSDIKNVQIRLTYAESNSNAIKINNSKSPDGILYKDVSVIQEENNLYYFPILNNELLKSAWEPGVYYKVQMRFGSESLWTGSNFASWKQSCIVGRKFSEWSTVMLLKAITQPVVEIANNNTNYENEYIKLLDSNISVETTSTPIFIGTFYCPNERLSQYKFQLFDEDGNLLEDSGWLQNNMDKDNPITSETDVSSANNYRFRTILDNYTKYSVRYYIRTENLFEMVSSDYKFLVNINYLSALQNITLEVEDDTYECLEEGYTRIYLTGEGLIGNYVLSRVDERDNYGVQTDIYKFTCFKKDFRRELIFTDFTIESGVRYKYMFQKENSNGLRSTPLFEAGASDLKAAPARTVDLQYSYLFHNGRQLKLMFNNEMNSFKHTHLAAKQDTIGGKYPTIFKNAYAHYAEFPVNGLISLLLDENQSFFDRKDDGYYYKDKLVIPIDKYPFGESVDELIIDHSQTDLVADNVYAERKARECIEDFLLTNDYKLFRSPTEGNIIISLINVSMQPNKALGRMLYSFTSIAYEVLDNTYDNLVEYKIANQGGYTLLDEREDPEHLTFSSFGQISGLFTGLDSAKAVDILQDVIIPECNSEASEEGYKYVFKSLDSISFEAYPQIDLSMEKSALDKKIADLQNIYPRTAEQENELQELQLKRPQLDNLIDALSKQLTNPQIVITLKYSTGATQDITLGINKVYAVKNGLSDVESIYLKYTQPVIINYIYSMAIEEDESMVIVGVYTSDQWDQIYGAFGDYGYGLDILSIIEQKVQNNIAKLYNVDHFNLNKDGEQVGKINNKNLYVYYKLTDILSISIEADMGTVLKFADNDSKHSEIIIGSTQRYTLNPANGLISYLVFDKPAYAVIDFKCRTQQTIKGVESKI